jgi:CheY-like chemotaxis protein
VAEFSILVYDTPRPGPCLTQRGRQSNRGDLTLLAATLNNLLKGEGPVRRAGAFAFPMNRTLRPARPAALVVDDNPICRELAARALRKQGYHVTEATDGFKGIRVLVGHPGGIKLLVVATEMPGVHGWEVIRVARGKGNIRIIRLGRPEDQAPGAEYRALEMLPTLRRPFTEAALVASLRCRQARSTLAKLQLSSTHEP